MSIGGTVVDGTTGSVLFIGPGPVLAQNNAKFFWDDTNFALRAWGGEIFLYLTDPHGTGNAFACGAGNFTCEGLGAHSNAAIGVGSMSSLTTGSNNAAVGYFTLNAITTGGSNAAVGGNALQNLTTGVNNIGIGHLAGGGLTTGIANVAIGANAATGVTTGNANIGIGLQAMLGITTGSSNVGIGPAAGGSISGTSASNVYIGGYFGPSTTQTSTVVISDGSGGASGLTPLLDWQLNTSQVWSMSNVTPVGLHLYNTTDSGGSTFPAVNYERAILDWNVTSNVFRIDTQKGGSGTLREIRYYTAGVPALFRAPAGGDNWFIGNAGNFTASGGTNIGLGDLALHSLTSGNANMAIGNQAMYSLATGSNNVAVGILALSNSSSGANNVAIGYVTLASTNGTGNVGIGYSSSASSSGDYNVTIGYLAGQNLSSGGSNVLIGTVTNGPSSGRFNTQVGGFQQQALGVGESNVFIGYAAGYNISTGSDSNTWVGLWRGPSAQVNNTIALSYETNLRLDYNYITANIWSIQRSTSASGLHLYNTWDGNASPTDYERAVFDWNITSNVLVIGTQKGGTGSTRNIKFYIGGTNKLDYGVTTAGAWTVPSAELLNWSTDTGLARNGAGVVEVNNGTAGTFRDIKVRDIISNDATFIHKTSAALTDGAGTGSGVTFTNAPGSSGSTGNPTKWIAIDDNGTTRYIPCF